MTEYGNQIRSHSREWKTDDFFCLFFFGFVSLLLFICAEAVVTARWLA